MPTVETLSDFIKQWWSQAGAKIKGKHYAVVLDCDGAALSGRDTANVTFTVKVIVDGRPFSATSKPFKDWAPENTEHPERAWAAEFRRMGRQLEDRIDEAAEVTV